MHHVNIAKKHGRNAVIMAWSWPRFAKIMLKSRHGSLVFPTHVAFQTRLHIQNTQTQIIQSPKNQRPNYPMFQNTQNQKFRDRNSDTN